MKPAFKSGKNIIIITLYLHYYKKCMCFYHSVAINIEIDLLEVLDLNQIAFFS